MAFLRCLKGAPKGAPSENEHMRCNMKRIISILLCISMVLFPLVSCKKPDEVSKHNYDDIGNIPGDYIFNTTASRYRSQNDGARLLKYNVHSGEWSYVCNDPFCTHDSDKCFFYGGPAASFTYIGNNIYFVKMNETKGKYGIYAYNVSENTGSYIYYFDRSAYAKLIAYKYKLFFEEEGYLRIVDTKKFDVLTYEKPYRTSLMMIRNDEIYWYKAGARDLEYIITDLSGNRIRECNYVEYFNGFRYRMDKEDGYFFAYDLYRSSDGEKYEKVLDHVGPVGVYGDKLLYFNASPYLADEKGMIVKENRDEQISDLKLTELWVCDPDGSNRKMLVKDLNFTELPLNGTNPMICGEYAGIVIRKESPVTAEERECNEDLLIVNMKRQDG